MPESKVDPAETDLRMAQDLLFFAYRDFTNAADVILAELGLGRAHHRALHFIGRNPGITVSDLLGILRITKQSLARVLSELMERGYVAQSPGRADRRQRLLTPDRRRARRWSGGCSSASRNGCGPAYREAGAAAVDGFRRVMRGIMDDAARAYIDMRTMREGGDSMTEDAHILVVDDDARLRALLSALPGGRGLPRHHRGDRDRRARQAALHASGHAGARRHDAGRERPRR